MTSSDAFNFNLSRSLSSLILFKTVAVAFIKICIPKLLYKDIIRFLICFMGRTDEWLSTTLFILIKQRLLIKSELRNLFIIRTTNLFIIFPLLHNLCYYFQCIVFSCAYWLTKIIIKQETLEDVDPCSYWLNMIYVCIFLFSFSNILHYRTKMKTFQAETFLKIQTKMQNSI